jgi:hypothetical protein
MVMWIRIGGALLVTLAVVTLMECFGVSALLSGRGADQAHPAPHARARELFWLAIFAVVMCMSVVAAIRRWTEQLRHVRVVPTLKRRQVG